MARAHLHPWFALLLVALLGLGAGPLCGFARAQEEEPPPPAGEGAGEEAAPAEEPDDDGAPEPPEAPEPVDEEEIRALIEKLADRDWKVRDAAEAKLRKFGRAAAPFLEEALDHEDAEVAWRAETLLEKMRWQVPEDLAEDIGDLFEDYDYLAVDERLGVIQAVVQAVGVKGIPVLFTIARDDEDPSVRLSALQQIHALGKDTVEDDVLEFLAAEETFPFKKWAALLRHGRGEADLALEACREALALNKHDPELNQIFVDLLMANERWEEAIEALEGWVEQNPKNPLYHVLLARAYIGTNREADAEEQLGWAFELEPDDLPSYVRLIRVCIDVKHFDAALRFIENSRANFPGEPDIVALKAEVHEARSEWNLAFRHYSDAYQAQERGSEKYDLYREKLRQILGHRGEGDLVDDDLLEGIHIQRIRVGLWSRLGEIYRKKGMHSLAIEELRRTLIFKRKDPAVLLELAEVYLEMGDEERSQETAARALKVPDLTDEAVVRLEALRDGRAKAEARASAPPLLWKYKASLGDDWEKSVDRNGHTWKMPPVVAGDVLVTAVHGCDTIVGIDLASGRERWRLPPPEPPEPSSGKEHALDLAYLAPAGDAVHALYNVWEFRPDKARSTSREVGVLGVSIDPATGEAGGRYEAEAPVLGEPVASDDGRLVLSQGEGLTGRSVRLLDLGSGEVLWEKKFRKLSGLSPVLRDGLVWVAMHGGALVALDAATGERKRRIEMGEALTAPPVLEGDSLIAVTSRGRLVRADAETGEEAWSSELPAVASGLALLPGERVAVSHRGGKITCWGAGDGSPLWEADPGKSAERLFLGNDSLVFTVNGVRDAFWDEFAELLALRPGDGAVLWRVEGRLGGTIRLAGSRVLWVDGDLPHGFRVLAVSSDPGEPTPEILANVLRLEALDRAESRQREVAVALLRRAIRLHESPGFWYDLSRLYLEARDLDAARDAAVNGKDVDGADTEAFDALLAEIEREVEERIARREAAAEAAAKAAGEAEKKDGEGEEDGEEEDDPPGDDEEDDPPGDDPPGDDPP